MASCWYEQFNAVEECKKESLKTLLESHTFVGEYCGNQELQHMVRYTEEEIRFYAAVEKEGPRHCLPLENAQRIFDSYDLPFVEMETFTNIVSEDKLV